MREYWINMYPHGRGYMAFERREWAVWAAKGTAIYMIHVIMKFR